MKQRKLNGRSIAIALGIMVVGAFVLCALVGVLVENQIVPEDLGRPLSVGMTELSVLLVIYWTARRSPQKRFLIAMFLTALFLGLRLLLGMAVFPGEGIRASGCLLTLGAATAAGLMSRVKKQRRR